MYYGNSYNTTTTVFYKYDSSGNISGCYSDIELTTELTTCMDPYAINENTYSSCSGNISAPWSNIYTYNSEGLLIKKEKSILHMITTVT